MNDQTWRQLLSIQTGGAICLPIFLIGNLLASQYGWKSALLAIGAGNFLLLLLSLISARASARDRKSTAAYAAASFGTFGKVFFAIAMALAMMGWFAIQLHLMSQSLLQVLGIPLPLFAVNLFLGLLISLFAVKGIRILTRLANVSMPILIATIGYAVFQARSEPLMLQETAFTFSGISLVLAAAIGVVVDLPTFFKEAKSFKDGAIACCLLFGLVVPALEAVGVYLYLHSQGGNFLEVLTAAGSSPLWKSWVLLFLLMAGWTTNNANLYSASVSMQTSLPKMSDTKRVLAIGLLGSMLCCLDLEENMIPLLDGIGVLLSSMGAVLTLHYLSRDRLSSAANFWIWIAGVAIGALHFSGIGVLDAFAGAFSIGGIYKYIKGVTRERNYLIGS